MAHHRVEINFCLEDEEHNLTLKNCRKNNPPEDHVIYSITDFLHEDFSFSFTSITQLEITNTNLESLPNCIKQLPLKKMILSYNQLKEVPSCFNTDLKNLEYLDLSHNLIKSFDIFPAFAKKIVTLILNNNLIENFPNWIMTIHCPNLRNINYSRNNVKKLHLYHQQFIEKIEMRNCRLMADDLIFFKKIKTLKYLDIGNDEPLFNENRFRELDFPKNNRWENLQVLHLNHVTLSIIPKSIFWITTISELNLVKCDLNWIPEEIEYLVNLEILDISENEICSLPVHLTFLRYLRIVKAQSNSISSVASFTTALHTLDLYNNRLENVPVNLDSINHIDLEENFFDTSAVTNYENYKMKKQKLREIYSCKNRKDGFKKVPEEQYNFAQRESEDSSDEASIDHNYAIEVEDECWDEEIEIKPKPCKHPDITCSDDEWNGEFEIMRNKNKPNQIAWFDPDEDWIFKDTDDNI